MNLTKAPCAIVQRPGWRNLACPPRNITPPAGYSYRTAPVVRIPRYFGDFERRHHKRKNRPSNLSDLFTIRFCGGSCYEHVPWASLIRLLQLCTTRSPIPRRACYMPIYNGSHHFIDDTVPGSRSQVLINTRPNCSNKGVPPLEISIFFDLGWVENTRGLPQLWRAFHPVVTGGRGLLRHTQKLLPLFALLFP